uniref:Uncharacterized protein n=1 Tax=Panagrolaimus sp. PS1159 TaxID=55785 RepID=A0AC35F218_9BILA
MHFYFIFITRLLLLPLTLSEVISSSENLILAENIADESSFFLETNRTWIPCNDFQICTERDRISWKSKRTIFDFLQQAKYASEIGLFVEKDSPMVHSIRNRTSLCEDFTIAPFLMNKESDQWPIACVWSGGQTIGFCAPAPPSYSFTYIPPNEWSRKVKQFRTAIGCSKKQIKAAEDIEELYICRERCVDVGLSYYQAMVLSLGICLFLTALLILN